MRELVPWMAMELKVWVDGIQRVISGVSETTTCQDVVIALAHAMGRTGRFTLVEKWRDTERPLVPAEFPLQVLQKWGEYAGEVRLFLKQSDLDKHKSDGSSKGSGGSHAKHKDKFLLHNFSPPSSVPESTSVRRSSTFSGAHKSSALSQPGRSKPVAHPRKNPLPHSVQNGGVGTGMGAPNHPSSSLHPLPAPGFPKTSSQGVLPSQRLSPRPADQDRTSRKVSVINEQDFTNSPRGFSAVKPVPAPRGSPVNHSGGGVAAGEGSRDGSLPRRTSPSNRTPSPQDAGALGPSHLRRFSPSRSSGAFFLEEGRSSSPFSRVTPLNRGGPLVSSGSGGKGGVAPFFPRGRLGTVDSGDGEVEELKLDAPPLQPKLISHEIEEYDLDQNFPDTPRDMARGLPPPGGHTEYRLDGSGEEDKGVVEVDAEKVRLLRMVNLQQERFKLQESQISIIDTEIQSLEEKAREREEEAKKTSQEQHDLQEQLSTLETELTQLEVTSWEERLKEQEQEERELREELAGLKEKLQRVRGDLAAYQEKEQELEKQVQAARTQRQQEEERQKRQEEVLTKQVEEAKRELAAMETELEPKEKELVEVEKQLQEAEEELQKKKQEAEALELSLKDSKLPGLSLSPPPSPAGKTSPTPNPASSGEAILKILEGRLSPRPGSSGKPGSPSQQQQQQQAFISALNSKNPNGVWV